MKKHLNCLQFVAVIIATFGMLFSVSASTNKNPLCKRLSSTNWMLGSWQAKTSKTLTTEVWRTVNDDYRTGIGITKKMNSNKAPFVESLGLIEMAGEVFYLAKPPQNEVPVAFKLVECSDTYLKFTNVDHDFPQVIEYTKYSDKRMVAVVSGGNKRFDIDFTSAINDEIDNIETVKSYVDAYNRRDLAAMLTFATADIVWMMVFDDKVSVETKNKAELALALEQHFSRPAKSHSSLSSVANYGGFVSGIEKVTTKKEGQTRSACSLSVYQFTGNKIKAVWYYPAQSC